MTEQIEKAAIWLADQKDPPRPIVPHLRRAFGLSVKEACEACHLANLYRTNRRAFG